MDTMAYIFSMEKILEMRFTKEKNAMAYLGSIQGELVHQKALLQYLRDRLEDEKNRKSKRINIRELIAKQLYKEDIENQITRQLQIIKGTKEKIEQARQELIKAQKNRKVMKKLKEKDYTMNIDSVKAAEQSELDEIAVLRTYRQ